MSDVHSTPAQAETAAPHFQEARPLDLSTEPTTKPVADTTASTEPAATETSSALPTVEAAPATSDAPAMEESNVAGTTTAAPSVTSGVLGYKAPGLIK